MGWIPPPPLASLFLHGLAFPSTWASSPPPPAGFLPSRLAFSLMGCIFWGFLLAIRCKNKNSSSLGSMPFSETSLQLKQAVSSRNGKRNLVPATTSTSTKPLAFVFYTSEASSEDTRLFNSFIRLPWSFGLGLTGGGLAYIVSISASSSAVGGKGKSSLCPASWI